MRLSPDTARGELGEAPQIAAGRKGHGKALDLKPANSHLNGAAGYLASLPPDDPRIAQHAVIANLPAGGGLTMEASFMLRSFHPIPGVGVAGLVTQWGTGGLMPSLVLAGTESNNPSVSFSIAVDGAEVTYQPAEPLIGDWHQVAGVYRVGDDAGQSTMELWLDGKKVGEKSFPTPDKKNVLAIPGFAFGVDAPTVTQGKTTGRVIDGLLDDVAISTEPLTPGTFIFPKQ